MADGHSRSSEEREAARLQRERRRADRTGDAPAPPIPRTADRTNDSPTPPIHPVADRTGDAPAPPIHRAADQPAEALPVEPVPTEPPAQPFLPRVSEPEPPAVAARAAAPPARPREPPPAPAGTPEVAGISARPVKTLPSPPDPEFYSPEPLKEPEVASGTRRVSRLSGQRSDRGKRRSKSPAGRPRPVKGRRRSPGTRHSWLGRMASLVALVLAGGLVWFLVALFQPLGVSPHGRVTVTIAPHASASAIGKQLEADQVIASAFFFNLRATLAGDRSNLRAGTYHLQLGMSYHAVLAALTKVPKGAKTSQLTINEGHTRQYVAQLLRAQKIKGSYLAATLHSRLLDPHAYGAPRRVPSLEGFLFPDTFTLVDPVKASTLVGDQLKDFKRRFATVDLRAAKRLHLSAYDVLTVASLIEAEAASDRARPLVASVIYNRLRDNMMLQFDSTTRYATGNFTRPLRVSELNSPSLYNTHTHFGLPPTPIDSPGLASIQAAAHPARSSYLYFFAKPCSNDTVFASNYAQFLGLLQRDRRPHCR